MQYETKQSAPIQCEETKGLDDNFTNQTIEFVIGKACGYPEGVVFHVNKEAFMKMSPVINAAYGSSEESDTATSSEETPTVYDNINPKTFAKIVEYVEHHQSPTKLPMAPCVSKDFSYCVERIIDSEGKSQPGWDARFFEDLWSDPLNRGRFMDILKHANFFGIECLIHKLACRIGCVLMGKQEKEMIKIEDDGTTREETDDELIARLNNLIDPLGVCNYQNHADGSSAPNDSIGEKRKIIE
jgi:hypothetical protein